LDYKAVWRAFRETYWISHRPDPINNLSLGGRAVLCIILGIFSVMKYENPLLRA